MPSQADDAPAPEPEPAIPQAEVQQTTHAQPAAPEAPLRSRRFTTERISAAAAVAGVALTALGLYLAYGRDDDPTSRAGGTLGPVTVISTEEAIDAEGTYESLAPDETVMFMVQPAESDPVKDTWITMIAERTPTETGDGVESGEWRTRWPVTDPDQAWRHAAGIGPAIGQGVEESETLSRLAEEGPDSSLLTSVTDVSVYEPDS